MGNGQDLLLTSLNKDFLVSLDTPSQVHWTSNLEGRGVLAWDVSKLSSEGGTLDMGTKVPHDFTKTLERESVKGTCGGKTVCVSGRRRGEAGGIYARGNIHT